MAYKVRKALIFNLKGLSQIISESSSGLDLFLDSVFGLRQLKPERITLENLQVLLSFKLESIKSAVERTKQKEINEIYGIPQVSVGESKTKDDMQLSTTTSTSSENNENEMKIEKSSNSNTEKNKENSVVDKRKGRLGPRTVLIPKKGITGSVILGENELEIESHSNFSSVRANVCVYAGHWMYEATLGTSGIQQIGWCTLDTPFTNEEGVGDSPDSYAYDGKREKKWSVENETYGQSWSTGDVIGVCGDFETGSISFYRNGESLGVAFDNVRIKENAVGLAYFPALSLSTGEKCAVNFGGRPFAYPVKGFYALQMPPEWHLLEQAQYLVDCFRKVIESMFKGESIKHSQWSDDNSVLHLSTESGDVGISKADISIVMGTIMQNLAPLLMNEYIFIHVFYPLLETFVIENKHQLIYKACEQLNTYLEEFEAKTIFSTLFSHIAFKSRTNTAFIRIHEHPKTCFTHFYLLLELVKSPFILDLFFTNANYGRYLEDIFATKPPSRHDLRSLFTDVWWNATEEEHGLSKEKYEFGIENTAKVYNLHEDLQFQLAEFFLENTNSLSFQKNTISHLFKTWLRKLIEKNQFATRNIIPPGLSDPTVLVNIYFILLKRLNKFFKITDMSSFPDFIFHSDVLSFYDFTRVGGVVTHVAKTFPIPSSALQISSISLDVELFDDLILFYHLAAVQRYKQSTIHLQAQTQQINQLEDSIRRAKKAKDENRTTIFNEYTLASKLLREDLCEMVRFCAWHRVVLYPMKKQEQMLDWIGSLVKLLNYISTKKDSNVFSYVPEYYIETLVESFHALRRSEPVIPLTEQPHVKSVIDVILFLAYHFNDKRIVNPDIRDLLLQSMNVLLQYPEFIKVFDMLYDSDKQQYFVNLLSSFDARFWIPICNILLRFWRGTGFASKRVNEYSCESFRSTFRHISKQHNEIFYDFLNKVFNNLNWALTEFGVSVKEVLRLHASRNDLEFQQMSRKCNVMFELSVSLLRILEFISLEVPQYLVTQEVTLSRLVELLLFVLNRSTTGHDAKALDSLMQLENSPNDKVMKISLLAPVSGTIINLASNQLQSSSLAKKTIQNGGFNLEAFQFLAHFDWQKSVPDDKSIESKCAILKEFVKQLEAEIEVLKKKESSSQSEELCVICCSTPIDTKFEPCHHESCRLCIQRHLLNSKKCFFCNAEISSIRDSVTNEPV